MDALLLAAEHERKRSFSDMIAPFSTDKRSRIRIPKKKARSASTGAAGGSPCGSFVLSSPGQPQVVYRRASVYFSIVKSSRKFPGYFDPQEKTKVVIWTKNIANGGPDMDPGVVVTARTGSGRDRHKITRCWNYQEVKEWYKSLYARLQKNVEESGGKSGKRPMKKASSSTPPLSRSNSTRSETPSTQLKDANKLMARHYI